MSTPQSPLNPTTMLKEFWLFSRPHVPSVVTISALSTAFASVFFALEGDKALSVSLVWVAGMLDALDGRLARYLNATSEFGAEIDSLADLVSFGVSPSLCVYIFTLKPYGLYGYLPCCFFTSCMAIRLARFNVTHTGKQPDWHKLFFTGVPAPAGAYLLLLPYTLHLASIPYVPKPSPEIMMAWIVVVAGMLVSNLRTYSFKKADVRRRAVLYTWAFASGLCFAILALFFGRWHLSSAMMMAYLMLIPCSHYSYLNYKSNSPPNFRRND